MSKSITYGLLAFAVSSSLLVAQGEKPAGGWSAKAGSGITYDGGDQFGINMLNFVQARWGYTKFDSDSDERSTNSFDVPRARTLLRGHAFNKNINYVLQVDYLSGSSTVTENDEGDLGVDSDSIVRDAYVHWNFADNIGLRLGQGKTQWGLENTGTIRGTMFTERSSASQLFSLSGQIDAIEDQADLDAAFAGDNARSRGAWLMGTNMDNKLRWSAGLMNRIGTDANGSEEGANDDNEFAYVLSANYDLLGDYFGGAREWWSQGDLRDGDRNLKGTVGIGYGADNLNDGSGDPDTEVTALNLNTAWSIQGFQVIGEYNTATLQADGDPDDTKINGYYVQGTYALAKSGDSAMRYAVGLRYSSVDLGELFVGGDTLDVNDISLVVDALYNGHNCKTQLELTQRTTDAGDGDDTKDLILGVAFQLVF